MHKNDQLFIFMESDVINITCLIEILGKDTYYYIYHKGHKKARTLVGPGNGCARRRTGGFCLNKANDGLALLLYGYAEVLGDVLSSTADSV